MAGSVSKWTEKAGLPPGSPIHVGERRMERARITTLNWTTDRCLENEDESVRSCLENLPPSGRTWINVDGLHDVGVVQALGGRFGLHPLVVEDILNTHLRPKFEAYEDYLFVSLKMHMEDGEAGSFRTEQVSIVLGRDWVLTFQEVPGDVFEVIRERLRSGKGRYRSGGPDYLAYALMDSVIDHLFLIMEDFGERLEELEDELIENPTRATLQRIHGLRRDLIRIRKTVSPLRDVVSGIRREDTALIQEATRPYLRDLHDHVAQALDILESSREIVAANLEAYLSSLSNRMNEVMKVLTIFAAVFIPLTFIAGIYGMNFNTQASRLNMPELDWAFGYPFALGLMALVGGGMLLFFRLKKWF